MKLLIVGDVCPTDTTNPLFEKGEKEALFGDFLNVFKAHDFSFVNLECALTNSENKIEKFGPNLKACKNTANVLKEVGVNLCCLSNNHIFDYGIEGYRDTVAALDEVEIDYTGFGENYEDSRKNYSFKDGDQTITIVNVCEHEYSYALDDRMGARPFDAFDTLDDIRAAKAVSDRVIVVYHGGKEHCRYPSPRLRKVCQAMVKAGADLVTTQHSHCIGCYENFEGSHIMYGQGNFHFVKLAGEKARATWETSLAISYDTKKNTVEFIPHRNNDFGIELAKGEEKAQIMEEFKERNESLLNGTWKDGWHAFCEDFKSMYINAVKRAQVEGASKFDNDLFGHYLDCEAHSDVWRELFPTANQTNEK